MRSVTTSLIALRDTTRYQLALCAFVLTVGLLSFVQAKASMQLLLLDRFMPYGGWIEIPFIGIYAAFLTYRMSDPAQSAKWRLRSWSLFTIVFFGQLALGLLGHETFLMTGKLHLPVPAMILGGPVYRGQATFMTFLFLSTVILAGPVWCSHLCYFGAMDAWAAKGKKKRSITLNPYIRFGMVGVFISTVIVLRFIGASAQLATLLGAGFGIIGLCVIAGHSFRKKQMVHCTHFCPIGIIVSYLKRVNPFRLTINQDCTLCMNCSSVCKYGALHKRNIIERKPATSCTYCGDCISTCHVNAFEYHFFKFSPAISHRIYLVLSVSLHAIFLSLGRI